MATTRFYADLPNEPRDVPIAEVYDPRFVQAIRKAIWDREQELRRLAYVAKAMETVAEDIRQRLGTRTTATISLSCQQFDALACDPKFKRSSPSDGWFAGAHVLRDNERPN